ncbi:MAG: hypothetical protein M3Q74_13290 [Pseudomonadota bacterium]|nr:hypothetical protein [Pseudomonadota bacterium]
MLALVMAIVAQDAEALPNGARLAAGEACYLIADTRSGQARPLGRTYQRIDRETVGGREVLRILVHQEVQNGAFRMRDRFVLDAGTMLPIEFESRRNGEPHVTLTWSADGISGERHGPDGASEAVSLPLTSPVWEGNLWGLHFAALPISDGARFALPFWQYDKGFGVFSITVKGSRIVNRRLTGTPYRRAIGTPSWGSGLR